MSDQSEQPKWQMTAKLPLLIAAVAVAVLGWAVRKKSRMAAMLLAGVAAVLFIWSASISQWCAPADTKFGGFAWGQQTFHESPTLLTCLKRVYGGE